jgi:hypothetical protein
MYTVTYRERLGTTEKDHDEIMTLETADVELADVVAYCQHFGIDADLYDAAGFRRGWVHQDGTYTLR